MVNDSLLFQESNSQTWVSNTLSVIKDKISLIRQIGNDIKANKIQVNPFDIDEKNAAAKEGQWIMNVAHSLVKKHREKEIKQQPWSTNTPSVSRPANTQNTVRRVYYANEGSTVGGFCLGFFLGLLGLIIALVTKEDRTKSGAVAGFIVYILIAVVVGIISYFVLRTHNY